MTTLEDSRLLRLEQAALWLQRMRNAGQDESVMEAWLDWCQRDALNQQAFDEMAAVWELGGQLASEPRGVQGAREPFIARRRLLAASLGGLGLVAGIAGAWWLTRPVSEAVLRVELSSPIGVNSSRTLADGSLLELGGGTRVTVSVGPRSRRVDLHEGEVYATVRPDASRPFSVDAGRLEVIATGTAFNVLRTEERTTVTVTEGSVDALYEGQAAATPNVRLKSSEQLIYTYSNDSHHVRMRQVDPGAAIAWRQGTLNFLDTPLTEAIATINRYAARRIVIGDPRIGALLIGGTAHADNIAGWLQGLQHLFPVTVVDLPDGRQRIDPRPGAFSD